MRRLLVVGAALALCLAGFPFASATASDSTPDPLRLDVTGWERTAAPLPDAGDGIGPGSYLLIDIDSSDDDEDGTYICTANFVWTDSSTTYLGSAGHCFLPSGETKAVGSNPWVTKVEVCVQFCAFGGQLGYVFNGDFVELGEVVYARQHKDGDDGEQIGYDFGLVEIPPAHAGLVRPQMPVWGGPTGSADRSGGVCHYGNGVGVGETFTTKARTGVRTTDLFFDKGWEAEILINGGDSGSAINMCDPGATGLAGNDALGIITHGLIIPGVPVGWGTTVAEAKAMVQSDWGRTIDLVLAGASTGTDPGSDPEPDPDPSEPNDAPAASFTVSCDSSTCTFDGTGSTDSDGSIVEYIWDFGDGSSGSGDVVSHKYRGAGSDTYTVMLTVQDNGGATDSASSSVSCSGRGRTRTCAA